MPALFSGGRVIDLVLAFVLVEGLVLLSAWRFAGRGLRPREVVSALVPGACLMLALREALSGQSGAVIAAWLFAALVSHLADLALRWKKPWRGRYPFRERVASPLERIVLRRGRRIERHLDHAVDDAHLVDCERARRGTREHAPAGDVERRAMQRADQSRAAQSSFAHLRVGMRAHVVERMQAGGRAADDERTALDRAGEHAARRQ